MTMFNVVLLLACCFSIAMAGPTDSDDELDSSTKIDESIKRIHRTELSEINATLEKLFVPLGTSLKFTPKQDIIDVILEVRKFGLGNALPCLVWR